MTDDRGDTYATRGAQMFLRFTDEEIARLAKFGEPRSYKAGDMLARTGEVGPGLMLILSGQVEVTQHERRSSAGRSSCTSAAISWASSRSCRAGRTSSTSRR